jgi:rubrerythrin/uncharacterized membrane protein
MSEWECGVCGYVHKEGQPPEKCPICEAPQKMFIEKKDDLAAAKDDLATADHEEQASDQPEAAVEQDQAPEKQWRCTVSGYLHTGPQPPEKCPVCEATADQFEEVVASPEVEQDAEPEQVQVQSDRRWRCSVCGYIHQADQPPDKCPLCGADKSLFVEIDAEGKVIGGDDDTAVQASDSAEAPAAAVAPDQTTTTSTFFDMISNLILKFHLHPIHTHFPNGILPVLVIFLGLSIYFKIAALEAAAFFNAIAVLIMLPAVILTGYVEWQKRYRGIKSAIFITKIVCSLIVLGSVNVLVFWRIIDPGVATEGSPSQLIYFAVAAIALAAAGIAGHLGGKLVFASRN